MCCYCSALDLPNFLLSLLLSIIFELSFKMWRSLRITNKFNKRRQDTNYICIYLSSIKCKILSSYLFNLRIGYGQWHLIYAIKDRKDTNDSPNKSLSRPCPCNITHCWPECDNEIFISPTSNLKVVHKIYNCLENICTLNVK